MGMPGVSTWNFGEAFAHLYLDSVAMNHNSIGRGYETWGNGTAETLRRTVPPADATMEWYRPLPPPAGEVTWSARDNLNYQETAALAALDYSAGNAKSMLHNFYKKGWDSWQKGLERAAVRVPDSRRAGRSHASRADGRTPARPAHRGGPRAAGDKTEGWRLSRRHLRGASRPALSQLCRGSAHAAALSQGWQRALRRRFLGVARALPGLKVIPTADSSVRSAALTPLTEEPHPAGAVAGAGPVFLMKDTGQEGLLAARYRLAEIQDRNRRTRSSAQAAPTFPAGSWILPAQEWTGRTRSAPPPPISDWTSPASRPRQTFRGIEASAAASACGCLGRIPIRSAGSATRSISARFPISIFGMRTFAPGTLRDQVDVLLYGHVDLELAEQIQGLAQSLGPDAVQSYSADAKFRQARGIG